MAWYDCVYTLLAHDQRTHQIPHEGLLFVAPQRFAPYNRQAVVRDISASDRDDSLRRVRQHARALDDLLRVDGDTEVVSGWR